MAIDNEGPKDPVDALSDAITGGAAGQPRQVAKQMFRIIENRVIANDSMEDVSMRETFQTIINEACLIKGGDTSFRQVMKNLKRMLDQI